ncbi:hypothetical protein IPC1257_01375 [Pseudomonas aeruginosa]|nr:hypothetical protein IPC1257_01375 [Pseudomonas aeruginosa]
MHYYPAPATLPAFPDALRAKPKTSIQGGGGLRKRWKDKKGISINGILSMAVLRCMTREGGTWEGLTLILVLARSLLIKKGV